MPVAARRAMFEDIAKNKMNPRHAHSHIGAGGRLVPVVKDDSVQVSQESTMSVTQETEPVVEFEILCQDEPEDMSDEQLVEFDIVEFNDPEVTEDPPAPVSSEVVKETIDNELEVKEDKKEQFVKKDVKEPLKKRSQKTQKQGKKQTKTVKTRSTKKSDV